MFPAASCWIKFPDRLKTLASKTHAGDERLTFTTTYSPHLPTHRLRRLLVKHWHLIEKSPLLSRLFPNRPTVAFRTHKSIRKQLTRARLEDSKIVYKIDRDLTLLCEPLPALNAPPLIKRCSNNCLTCRALDTKPYIKSTSKGTYHNLKITNTISCKTTDVQVQPVESTEDQRSLKKRESAWIKALRTIEPYGLNIIP